MDERARGNRGLDDRLDRGGWLKARASLLSPQGRSPLSEEQIQQRRAYDDPGETGSGDPQHG